MATLDDKLLGEKLQYYCSSSEDEDDERQLKNTACFKDEEKNLNNRGIKQGNWDGTSTNTGPKGVLNDWRRYKQLETEQRKEQEKEKILLSKKLALSCRSNLDDEREKQKEEDIENMIDDEILHQFIQKRMQEMMVSSVQKEFGRLFSLDSADEFLEAIDKEEPSVTVIIHLFDESVTGCEAMNGCLKCLASDYPNIKFCSLPASAAGVSSHFQNTGLPALLVYKAGHMTGNFVRLGDVFGDDFFATDVEYFLTEHGILQDKSLKPSALQTADV